MDKNIIDTFRIDTIFLNNLHYIRYYHRYKIDKETVSIIIRHLAGLLSKQLLLLFCILLLFCFEFYPRFALCKLQKLG